MEKIKFYKLVSPYAEDETMNCKLTTADMDDNFLAFKSNDIESASYNPETMEISITRRNGNSIILDLSDLGLDINNRINSAISGLTPESGSTEYDVTIDGELTDDGVLSLTVSTDSSEYTTEISGFLTERSIKHDDTIAGDGSVTNPIGLSNTEKTGKYKHVLSIVDNLPTNNLSIGDRYVTKSRISLFGRLYNKEAVEIINEKLSANESLWRIPTKDDWEKLFNYADACDTTVSGVIGEYSGDICGKVLKSTDYWGGNENLDTFGFSVVPSGYVDNGILYGSGNEARFWTVTESNNGKCVVGFSDDHDNILEDESSNTGWYSIRLVSNIDNHSIGDNVNILGNTYSVININEIGQAWISINLLFNPGEEYSEQYDYDYDAYYIERDIYKINHWNGEQWESKELEPGDEFNIISDDIITTYICMEEKFNKSQYIVRGWSYKLNNRLGRIILDGGWY